MKNLIKNVVYTFGARLYRLIWNAYWDKMNHDDIMSIMFNKPREEFFLRCIRLIAFNELEGDYLEFGCHSGTSFHFAHKYSRLERLNMHLYAFDSFEGLPKPTGIDVGPQWQEGMLKHGVKDFENILKSVGMKKSEYTLIPGFYSDSLTKETQKKLNIKKAAFVFVDCDFYESTVPVLNFVLPFLQTGTILAFDDFYLYNGDPDRGEQLALKEFLQRNPDIELVEYLNFGWHGKSFIIKRHNKP